MANGLKRGKNNCRETSRQLLLTLIVAWPKMYAEKMKKKPMNLRNI